jgi:hypothetical protein
MPKAAARCKSKRPPKFLYCGTVTLKLTCTIVEPSALALLQKNTVISAQLKTTDPNHSAWGSHLTHHLTLVPRTLISKAELNSDGSSGGASGA